MNKLKDNLFEIFLLLYSIRSFIVGPTISDALVGIFLIISIVYTKYYFAKDKITDKNGVQADIDMLKQEIAKLKLDSGIKKSGVNGFR